MPNPITAIAIAISEGFKLLKQRADTAEIRRMNKAIDYGEKVIRRYEEITEKENQDKLINKYIKYFFKYNN